MAGRYRCGLGRRRIQLFFFSTPLRMLGWPVGDRHAGSCRRWGRSEAVCRSSDGALCRLSLVGGILLQSRRWGCVAAIGLPSVVDDACIFLFRMARLYQTR